MIPDEQRAAWQALADAATPGPWEAERIHHRPHGQSPHECWEILQDEHVLIDCIREDEMDAAETAEFIAAAREAVPALLAALRETEAERDEEADSNRWLRSNVFTLENERDALARRIEAVRDILAATRPQYSPLGVECPETAHGLHARIAAALDGEDGA